MPPYVSEIDQAREKRGQELAELERGLEQVIDRFVQHSSKSKQQAVAAAADIIGKLSIRYGAESETQKERS